MTTTISGGTSFEAIKSLVTKSNYNWIKVLIHSEVELEYFMKHYWISLEKVVFSLSKYRRDKASHMDVSPLEFLSTYNEDKKHALEQLFLFPVTSADIQLLESEMREGNITLLELYNKHKSLPDVPLARLIA